MLKIPTIEETIEAGAYEARMHFLCPDSSYGRYITQPGMVTEPTSDSVQKELPYEDYPGFLMWVDFAKPEIIGHVNGNETHPYRIKSQPVIGRIVITTYKDQFEHLDDFMENAPENNSFVKLWLGKFAVDRTRNFFGDWRHPLGELYDLYRQLGIKEELDALKFHSKAENWDSRIDIREWYIASLAQVVKATSPDLFSGGVEAWNQKMGFPLQHRVLPA